PGRLLGQPDAGASRDLRRTFSPAYRRRVARYLGSRSPPARVSGRHPQGRDGQGRATRTGRGMAGSGRDRQASAAAGSIAMAGSGGGRQRRPELERGPACRETPDPTGCWNHSTNNLEAKIMLWKFIASAALVFIAGGSMAQTVALDMPEDQYRGLVEEVTAYKDTD